MEILDKVNIMIEQCNDIQKILDDGVYAKIAFVNFKQRQRFMACSFAKDSEDAINRLYEVEAN